MTDDTNNNEHPSEIGPYKILDVLGEGGMSIVYLADQTEPMKRRVALKILKAGLDSTEILVRFDTERQALALMDYPNIATVFDAGTSDASHTTPMPPSPTFRIRR